VTASMGTTSGTRSLIELRLLDGPNLYFPRPAAKLTLDLTELMALPVDAARDLGTELGLGNTRPGAAGTVFRQRFAIRLVGIDHVVAAALILPLMTQPIIRRLLRLPAQLTEGAKIIGSHPDGRDLSVADRQHIKGADLHLGSGCRDSPKRGLVRPGMSPMHNEGHGNAVGSLDNLKHLGAQTGERRM
jgi:hypothetical protein